MSWKRVALQAGLLALDYGLKQRKKASGKKRKPSTRRKKTKRKG